MKESLVVVLLALSVPSTFVHSILGFPIIYHTLYCTIIPSVNVFKRHPRETRTLIFRSYDEYLHLYIPCITLPTYDSLMVPRDGLFPAPLWVP